MTSDLEMEWAYFQRKR